MWRAEDHKAHTYTHRLHRNTHFSTLHCLHTDSHLPGLLWLFSVLIFYHCLGMQRIRVSLCSYFAALLSTFLCLWGCTHRGEVKLIQGFTHPQLHIQCDPLTFALTILSQKGYKVKWQTASVETTGLWYPDTISPALILQHLVQHENTHTHRIVRTVTFFLLCVWVTSPISLYMSVWQLHKIISTSCNPNWHLKISYNTQID